MTVEELSVFCHWEDNGTPVECFLEVMPLKKAEAESIYTTFIKCLKDKNVQVGNIGGMWFDGVATFSCKKTGVQARLKKHAPHALFVHCDYHMLQLACVPAANSTTGIKHIHTTLTTLWKYFRYSPKRAESLRDSACSWITSIEGDQAIWHSLTCTWTMCESSKGNLHYIGCCPWQQLPEFPSARSFGIIQGSIPVQHHCSHLSTGLHLAPGSLAQQNTPNKTNWSVQDLFSCRCSSHLTGWCHYSSSKLGFGTFEFQGWPSASNKRNH